MRRFDERAPCDIDQEIDGLELGNDRGHSASDIGGSRYVSGRRYRGPAGVAYRPNRVGQSGFIDIDTTDYCALPRESKCSPSAEPRGRASHHGDSLMKAHCSFSLGGRGRLSDHEFDPLARCHRAMPRRIGG